MGMLLHRHFEVQKMTEEKAQRPEPAPKAKEQTTEARKDNGSTRRRKRN